MTRCFTRRSRHAGPPQTRTLCVWVLRRWCVTLRTSACALFVGLSRRHKTCLGAATSRRRSPGTEPSDGPCRYVGWVDVHVLAPPRRTIGGLDGGSASCRRRQRTGGRLPDLAFVATERCQREPGSTAWTGRRQDHAPAPLLSPGTGLPRSSPGSLLGGRARPGQTGVRIVASVLPDSGDPGEFRVQAQFVVLPALPCAASMITRVM